ncbi:Cyclin-D1-1 [Apostasia shenzhenica]|uniref:Cyclin-D1-1 n=1 Tax=Apostasia shenzhenica TaxID=1088818 RepID=A0A2H9ZX34_9ASPA|nr:Cyclin-D1-1 [Apostasia shenzhenica]
MTADCCGRHRRREMELSATEEALPWRNLFCEENAGELSELSTGPPAAGGGFYVDSCYPEESDESIAGFVEWEVAHSPEVDYPARLRSRSINAAAREAAVSWILRVNAYHHFQPLTAYLAVNYVDRFLSAHRLPKTNGWPLQLLSVACLSIAAKLEETFVPSLLDLQVEGARFMFEPETVCKMELLVLTALKWRLRPVTPFNFVDFFACKVDPSGSHTRYLASLAAQAILPTTSDINFLDYWPSSIAAASIICAADEIPDIACTDPQQTLNWCTGLDREGIISCYRLMQQVLRNEAKSVVDDITSETSSSSFSSLPPNKKRKLNNYLTHEVEG